MDSIQFDFWSKDYDEEVKHLCDENSYPFAGYNEMLNAIYDGIKKTNRTKVLDLGIGTGSLCSELYKSKVKITGVDFSKKMLQIAQEKMPDAKMIEADFSKQLPEEVTCNAYDVILMTYSIHHLDDDEKIKLIDKLLPLLSSKGQIIIGDICFFNEDTKVQSLSTYDNLDESEHYFTYDFMSSKLRKYCDLDYKKISHCAGILRITNSLK